MGGWTNLSCALAGGWREESVGLGGAQSTNENAIGGGGIYTLRHVESGAWITIGSPKGKHPRAYIVAGASGSFSSFLSSWTLTLGGSTA